MGEEVFDKNVGYGDAGEEYVLEMESEKRKKYPKLFEIMRMCEVLGIKHDPRRDIREEEAWAYYYELKSQVEQHQRKTA